MEGEGCIGVIVDRWVKGLGRLDVEVGYEGMGKGGVLGGGENVVGGDNEDYV